MSTFTLVFTIVVVSLAVGYRNGNNKKGRRAPGLTPDGMWLLYNPRTGNLMVVIFGLMAAFLLFFGVLCYNDIGFGQGGVVFLFFLTGGGLLALGFFFKWLSDRNRICFDERRIIQYRAVGRPIEMEWWEVMEYSCNPQRTYLISADGRRINVDFTYDGFDELIQMIQEKVASR